MSYFILYFAVFAASAVGLGNLYLHLIQPIAPLSFMQKALDWSKPKSEFLYKSIGGCKICTIQRFADLSFIFLMCINRPQWYFIFPLYCLYGGLVFYFQSVGNNGEKVVPVNSKNIEL